MEYDDKVRELEEKIESIATVIADFEKKRNELQLELGKLRLLGDKAGKRVVITEWCRRGCCIEGEKHGVILDAANSHYFRIQLDDGSIVQERDTDIKIVDK